MHTDASAPGEKYLSATHVPPAALASGQRWTTQMWERSASGDIHRTARRCSHRRGQAITSAVAISTIVAAGITLAPSAVADPTDSFRDALMSVRGASSCGPLGSDSLAEQTSQFANQSNDRYLDHNARAVPMLDPLPTLKDLGSTATKAKLLQGAGRTEADAIKFIFISGMTAIADCSYTYYGLNLLLNPSSGWFLTTLVLAGA
jgi:hypothetical protein